MANSTTGKAQRRRLAARYNAVGPSGGGQSSSRLKMEKGRRSQGTEGVPESRLRSNSSGESADETDGQVQPFAAFRDRERDNEILFDRWRVSLEQCPECAHRRKCLKALQGRTCWEQATPFRVLCMIVEHPFTTLASHLHPPSVIAINRPGRRHRTARLRLHRNSTP